MVLQRPSAGLAAPHIETLKAGTTVHRIHLTYFAGNAFNPCKGGPTRFAPIHDASGKCVPSLYAASSFDAAAYETLFHDIPAKAVLKTIPKGNVEARTHTVLELRRDLALVTLNNPHVKRWNIAYQDLAASPPGLYAQTRDWAAAIHLQFPNVDGLLWASNQYTSQSACLFFGDRVKFSAFKIVSARDGAGDKTLLADARAAGRAADITITL